MMWLGHFSEHFIPERHWAWNVWTALAYGFVMVWLGAIVYCVVQFRAVFAAVGAAFERRTMPGDYFVYFGHVALTVGIVDAVWSKYGARDFVYGYLMLAALLHAIGLAMLALTFRSKTDRPQAAGR